MNHDSSTNHHEAPTDADMQALGAKLALQVPRGTVIYLQGSLGAGKTTFTRGFLRGLGYEGKVKSPTYTLVEPYHTKKYEVYHFDLYRLNSPDELLAIGIEDYFNPESVCLIEWPDKGETRLPPADLIGYFDIMEGRDDASPHRFIRFEANTSRGEEILARL
jgi:tRNA threonylcarbamoyladenosine biosynthesis protein TsaE